jgi:FlgD Ig-like domain
MTQSERKVKTAKTGGNLATSVTKMFLASILFLNLSYSQSFDLLSAKPVDKIAQSRFFKIDSNKVLNAYEINSFTVPVARIQDSVYLVAGIHASVSAAKNSAVNPVKDFSLDQNYPNPFNPSTTIRFSIGKTAKVSVVLFDMAGREVATLVNDVKVAGSYSVQWNGRTNNGDLAASGTYLYRMLSTADGGSTNVETKKMALLK